MSLHTRLKIKDQHHKHLVTILNGDHGGSNDAKKQVHRMFSVDMIGAINGPKT